MSLVLPAGDQPMEQRCSLGSSCDDYLVVRYSCDAVGPIAHLRGMDGTTIMGTTYRAAHELNLLEPGIVLLVNPVPRALPSNT